MLFGSTILEVAIGVIFVYLLLSLLCSAFNELLESFIKMRASDLKQGIMKLLGNQNLVQDFFDHSLVKALGNNPSYIPARTFSIALWNLATTKAAQGQALITGVTQDVTAVRNFLASTEFTNKYGESIRDSLLTLIDEAGGDINQARANIEGWYNDAMDRVSGAYKRRTHQILILIGFLAALVLNVDTIGIAKALWYNDALRSSVVAAAESYIKPPTATSQNTTAAPQTTPAASTTQDATQQANQALKKLNDVRGEIDKLGLPIGWDDTAPDGDPRHFPVGLYGWLLKLLGIIFTALAVSQGAPFWFDVLNKFIVIRSTIKPHEKSPEQPSKDKPAPETTKKQEDGNGQGSESKG
jgi:hypothetical protein